MNRRKFIMQMAALAAVPLLPACVSSKSLRVGVHPWIGYQTLYLAQDFGWLPSDVELTQNQSATDSIEGLLTGNLDAACLTLDEVLRVREANLPLSVVLVFNVSAGSDVIMARPEIQSLSDLRGKRIAVENNGTGALMFHRMLTAAGLKLGEVEVVDCPPDCHLSRWRDDHVDAIITYYPVAGLLESEGAHKLFDSRQMPDAIIDVLAVRPGLSYGKKQALRALVRSHFQGLEHIQNHRQDASYRIAGYHQFTMTDVDVAFSGVILPSLEGNRAYLSAPEKRLLVAARDISTVLVNSQLLKQEDELEQLVTSSFLPKTRIEN